MIRRTADALATHDPNRSSESVDVRSVWIAIRPFARASRLKIWQPRTMPSLPSRDRARVTHGTIANQHQHYACQLCAASKVCGSAYQDTNKEAEPVGRNKSAEQEV